MLDDVVGVKSFRCVAEVRGQLARAAVAMAARDHRVGAVRRPDCDNWRRDSIEKILSFTLSKRVRPTSARRGTVSQVGHTTERWETGVAELT